MPNAQSVGNPHPDATGLNKAAGIDVLLTLQYTRTNLSGPTYVVTRPFSTELQPCLQTCKNLLLSLLCPGYSVTCTFNYAALSRCILTCF